MDECVSWSGCHSLALVSPRLFQKIGVAGGCVFGNLVTGVLISVLLQLASQEPNSRYLIAFITTLYVGFPFTVVSQLTTAPMLDVIAPLDRRGYVQGLNTFVMNIGTAVGPWILGLLADEASIDISLWTGVGISFAAAAINSPLIFQPGTGPPRIAKRCPFPTWTWTKK